MAEDLVIYYSSVAVNSKLQIKQKQDKIFRILDSLKIPYTRVDISADDDAKQKMRDLADDQHALPPRICKGDRYLGDFDQFDEAVEMETLKKFLEIE